MTKMPDTLYGFEIGSEYIQLVETPDEEIAIDSIAGITAIKTTPTIKYIKDDTGDVFIEALDSKKTYYYFLHSEEIMNLVMQESNPKKAHGRYRVA